MRNKEVEFQVVMRYPHVDTMDTAYLCSIMESQCTYSNTRTGTTQTFILLRCIVYERSATVDERNENSFSQGAGGGGSTFIQRKAINN